MRCRFQSLVDIGGTMRRGQEHVVPGMKEATRDDKAGRRFSVLHLKDTLSKLTSSACRSTPVF